MHGAFSAIAARLVIVIVNKYSMAFCLFHCSSLSFWSFIFTVFLNMTGIMLVTVCLIWSFCCICKHFDLCFISATLQCDFFYFHQRIMMISESDISLIKIIT